MKKIVNNIFSEYCSTGIFTLKLQFSNNIALDLRWFGTLSVLSVISSKISTCTSRNDMVEPWHAWKEEWRRRFKFFFLQLRGLDGLGTHTGSQLCSQMQLLIYIAVYSLQNMMLNRMVKNYLQAIFKMLWMGCTYRIQRKEECFLIFQTLSRKIEWNIFLIFFWDYFWLTARGSTSSGTSCYDSVCACAGSAGFNSDVLWWTLWRYWGRSKCSSPCCAEKFCICSFWAYR